MHDLAGWAPALVSLVAAIYVYGRLAEKVNSHEKRLDTHELKLDDHSTRLTKLDAWHEGFSAGTHRG